MVLAPRESAAGNAAGAGPIAQIIRGMPEGEVCSPFHGQVRRFGAFEDLVHKDGGTPEQLHMAWAMEQGHGCTPHGSLPGVTRVVRMVGSTPGNGLAEGDLCGIAWFCEESDTVENFAHAAG